MAEKLQAHRVRITVMKKLFHEELVKEYDTHFEVGQVFETSLESPWEMPAGFCGWAWADLQKLVYGMARGGQETFVSCCTDGYRPVVFLLERI